MYIDVFIVFVLVWAAWTGWNNGFVRELASGVGIFAGLLVAACCYSTLGEYLAVDGSASNMWTSIVAFFILWIMVPLLLGMAATVLTKALKGLKLGALNALLGAGVALLKYTVLLVVVLAAMDALGILNAERAERSRLYKPLRGALTGVAARVIDTETGDASGSEAGDTVWIDNPNAR